MMAAGVCWLDYDGDGRLDLFVVNWYATTRFLDRRRRPRGAPSTGTTRPVRRREPGPGGGVTVEAERAASRPISTATAIPTSTSPPRRRRPPLERQRRGRSPTTPAGQASCRSGGTRVPRSPTSTATGGRISSSRATPTCRTRCRLHGGAPAQPRRRSRPAVPERGAAGSFAKWARRRARHAARSQPRRVFRDSNGDGRVGLYVANDLEPNRLYLDEPGGPLGFRLVDRPQARRGRRPERGMGIAAATTRRGATSASATAADRRMRRTCRGGRHLHRAAAHSRRPAGATGPAGATPRSTSTTTGGRPRAHQRRDPDRRVCGRTPARCRCSRSKDGRLVRADPTRAELNGRGLAAADYDDDGRVDLAVRIGRRPAGAPAQRLALRPLARRAGSAAVTGGRRHTRAPRQLAERARGAGWVELSLVGGSARAFRPGQLHIGARADRSLPGRHGQADGEPDRRPRAHGRAVTGSAERSGGNSAGRSFTST